MPATAKKKNKKEMKLAHGSKELLTKFGCINLIFSEFRNNGKWIITSKNKEIKK